MTMQFAVVGPGQPVSSTTSVIRSLKVLREISRRGFAWSGITFSLLAAVMLLGTLSIAAHGQTLAPYWYQQSPANNPGDRYIHSMAYDAGHGQVVLFGGYSDGYVNDTWLWNGVNWTRATPTNAPSQRAAPSMVYDPVHGNVVLFGGFVNASARLNDTWLWNGANWTNANPVNSPPARSNADMVYDAATGQIVLFGGTNGTDLGDTWLWDGTNWTQASPANHPLARSSYGMAYDAAIGQVVLFGGSANGNYVNDTWLWNGTTWTQASPSTIPPARYATGMEYDPATSQVIMFGGYNGSVLNDTWAFTGTNWTQVAIAAGTGPVGRYIQNALVYDSNHKQMVMYGGLGASTQLNDTWVFGLPGNFGNVNVCPAGSTSPSPCSNTIAFTYLFANGATLGTTPQVVTQGTAGLDFSLNPDLSTCSGTVAPGTCTVSVTFAPLAPGLRTGAIQLMDYQGHLLATTPVQGVGQGPAAAVAPGSSTPVGSGFTIPYGVAVDAAGNVYITDSGEGTVSKVAANGTSTQIGVTFQTPAGVAVDGAGDVFVADPGANDGVGAIVEIPSGCLPSSCQNTLPAPEGVQQQTGVAVDGAGDVFFSSLSPAQVTEIPAGCAAAGCLNVVWTPPAGVTNSQPNGIAVDAAGDLFIADGSIAQLYEVPAGCTTSACQVKVGSGLGVPTGVAVDAAGDLFVSASSFGVFEIPAGCTTYACQTVVLAGGAPEGVAVDGQGDIFVPVSENGSVLEIVRSQTQALNFPTTTLGTTSTASATLQNVGNQTLQAESPGLLTVSGASYSNTAGSGTPPDCSATSALAPGAQCNATILFSPQSYTQPNTGTAVFNDNSLNAPDVSQSVNLFGMGAKPVQTFYPVTVTEPGSGSGLVTDVSGAIDCTETSGTSSGTCAASLPGLGLVTFTATASGNSIFQGWGGACASAGTNSLCSIVLTAATTISASFVNPVTYPLTVTASGTGLGTVSDNLGEIACSGANGTTLGLCSGNYPGGTLVTLTAAATGTSVFAGWGGACSSSGASATCVVTMNSALNVSASFVAPSATQAGTLKPITAGLVYGQGGSFTNGAANNGGISANSLYSSQGMVFDGAGNLYVSDGNNNRVLFYPAGSTTATRVYGQNGSLTANASNNGGLSATSLSNPQGLALDSGGNLYVADEFNSRVLFYPVGSTTATRVYGQPNLMTGTTNTGGVSATSLDDPMGIALDSGGNLYVADYGNSRIMFYPSGSTTASRVYGQGGSFTSNTPNNGGISADSLNQPQAVALDSSSDLYVADIYNNRVLFYPANSTTASRVYGQGGSFTSGTANIGGVNSSTLNNPLALTVDASGGLYVVDRSNNRVLYYPFGSTTANRVYGQLGSFTAGAQNNGGVSANSLNQPWGIALDQSGSVYIADYGNNRVLEYGSFGNVNVCPANQSTPAPCNRTVTFSYAPAATTTIGAATVVTQGVTGLDYSLGTGGACTGTIAAGTSCTVSVNFAPLVPGLRAGAVELYDNTGHPAATAPLYGIGKASQIAVGPGTQSTINTGTLSTPKGVLADGVGNLFVSDTTLQQVIKIAPNGTRTTVGVGLQFPQGMAEDGAGDLFIADNNLNAIVEVPAGCAASGCQQVLGANLRSQLGVAVDGAGDLFIGDFLDGEVVKSPAGCTASACQTVVYNPGEGSNPVGITVDSAGNLYVADFGLEQVVEVPAGCADPTCQLRIGSGWSQPDGVAVDAAGDVFIADAGLDEIVEAPAGCTAAACLSVLSSGLNTVAVTADAVGDLFFEDFVNARVLELNRSQLPSLSFAQTNVGSTSFSPSSVSLQNIGNQPLTGSLALNLGGNFTQTNPLDCAALLPLAPGASCGETFNFTPQSATFLSGSATFTDNNLNLSPATQTFALSGTGATNGVAGLATVPNVVGQAQAAAPAPIATAGLALGTVSTASSQTIPSGSVISQNPVAGTQVAIGSAVNLLVSSGIAQPPSPNPLSLENNYFLTGDYVTAGVTLRGKGVGGIATGNITIPTYASSTTLGVPDGADIIDAFLYWETLENTPFASSTNGTFNKYPIVGQQIGNDIPNYVDGAFTGTIRAYRANVNIYLPVGANGIRYAAGTYSVSLPDGATALPLTEGASLVLVYRVLSQNFPLKSVVIYDGAAAPTVTGEQVVQGFYDAVGGANGTGKSTNLFTSNKTWNSISNAVPLGSSSQFSATLNPGAAYAAVILSTSVNNSDNDGILDAWKTGPAAGDFHAGQPGYYDVKTGSWVGLPGAKHGQKDLFVQLDYMCGKVLSTGSCDPTQENLFPSPDASGNDPLAMVQQAFTNSGVQLHLQIGNAVPEDTCIDGGSTQLCQFPNQSGVIGWKNSLEFSKLYPRNLAACLSGGDCTTRFPFGQKDSYHYVLMGHSLAIPAYNTRFGTLTSINVVNGVTTIVTADRGNAVGQCPSRITIGGVLGNPSLNGVYNTTGCADTKTISLLTPGVPNWGYPNNNLPEPVIGITSGTITSISGYSDLGGADSAVTLGLWLTAPNQDMSKKANVLAGTIFHEIGHTLGLGHGGLYYDTAGSYVPTFEGNCKPNYQSVMNYLFQLDLVGPNQTLAYSNQTLNKVDEASAGSVTQLVDSISSGAATFPTSAWYVPYTTGSPVSPATRHCDGTPLNNDSYYRVDAPIAPITPAWSSPQDISFTGLLGTPQTSERGFNDLANMDLRQVGATGGEFASLASVLSFGSSVGPLNISAGGTVALGSGGTISLAAGGTVALGSGGTVTLGSGGTVTLGSGGTVALGSGGTVSLPFGGTVAPGNSGTVTLGSGGTVALGSGGVVTLGSGGTVTLGSGGTVTLGSGGVIALGSGGTVTIPSTGGSYTLNGSGGVVTLGSGGTVALGSGGTVTLGSGGTVALGSGGTVALGSGGVVTLGSGGTVTLGSGGVVALGSGGTVTLGSGGVVALGSGGTVTLGSGGTVTLGSGGTVTLGSGGTTALGSGGVVTLGSGGTATLGAGGTVTLGSGGTVTLGSGGTVTLGSGGTVTLGSGGTITLGSGGLVTLGSGGTLTVGGVTVPAGPGLVNVPSGGVVTLGSGGVVALGSGGTVALGSGGVVALGSGGVVTLGSGGTVTLGSGGVVTLGSGGSVSLGSGSDIALGSTSNITPAGGGPLAANELTYETANSVVRPPTAPTETPVTGGVRITWKAPAFGVVQTYTIYRSSNGATPIVIGSVSGVNGNPPATEFTDTNPDTTSKTVVYTVTTTLVPDTAGPSRQSTFSPPAVLKNDQSIALGPLPSSVMLGNPPTVTATAMSGGAPNGLQVVFSATGSCAIGGQSIAGNVSSAAVVLNATGSCTVTASQPGSTAFNAANTVSGTFMILPRGSGTKSQTITFPPLTNVQYGGTFSLTATSNAVNPSIPVSFSASGPCATNGTVSGVGICKITASAPASGNYSAASLTQSFNVYPAVLKVTATSLTSTYGQPLPALTYTYSGFVNGDASSLIPVVSGAPSLSTTATATSNAGSYPITVSTGTLATANYSFLYVSGTLIVQPANQAIMFTTNPPASAAYNSSFTVAATGGASKNPVIFTSAGSCSNTGATFKMTNSTGTCSVVASQAGNSNYAAAQVTKTVTAVGPLLSVSPSSIDFGTVYAGSITIRTITLTNVGTAPATISDPILSIVKGGNSNEFIALSLCPKPLAVGKSCTVTIAFLAGPVYTPRTATLQIMSNAPGSPQPVALSAVVINPQARFSSTSLVFGTIKHTTSSTLNVILSNPGGTPLALTGIKVTGINAADFAQSSNCGTSLAAGAACTIAVRFTPPATGSFSANLTVTDNAQAGNGTQTVSLSGKGN